MSTIIDEALVELGLRDNLSEPMARAVAEARAEAERLGHVKATIKVKAETRDAKAELDAMILKLKELEAAEKRAAKANKAAAASNKAQSAGDLSRIQTEIARTRALMKTRQSALDDLERQSRVQSDISQMVQAGTREEAKSLREKTAELKNAARESESLRTADLRRAQDSARTIGLLKQEMAARQKVNDLTKAYSRAQASDKQRVSVDMLSAVRQMEVLHEELALIGRKPIEFKTKVDRPMRTKVADFFGFSKDDQIKDIGSKLQTLGKNALTTKFNIGFMRTSVVGLGAGLAALGPIIFGLIGALGSLISVAGAGVGGALGIASAGVAGFGMAAIGIGSALKPFLTQLQLAHSYTQKLSQAQAKYGANSKQGQAAQKAYNNEMKSLPPTVQAVVGEYRNLDKTWKGLTSSTANRDIGKIAAEGFKSVSALMPMFAAGTNQAFNALTQGWHGWMTQLRSSAAQQALGNIFGNFNKSIPGIMSGLGSLGAAWGRITSTFSNFLPGLSHGFAAWAKGIDNAATKSHGFASGVKTMVTAMRDLGHFAEATGRFLLEFFRAGVKPGEGMINDMTKGMNKLSASMSTVSGQRRLTDFFSRGVSVTKALWAALVPLVSAFVQFAQATSPIAGVALSLLSVLTKITAWAVGFKPLQDVLGLLAATVLLGRMTSGLRELLGLGKKLGGFALGIKALGVRGSWKNIFGSGVDTAAIASAIETASAAGAAEMGSAIESAGTLVAGEIGASMRAGGAAGAAENIASRVAAPVVSAGAGAEAGALTGAATGAAGAEAGLGAVAGAEGAVGAAAVGAETATAGFGATLAAVATGPVGIAIGATAALVAALSLFGNHTDEAAASQRALGRVIRDTAAVKGIDRTASVLPSIRAQGAQAVTAGPSDQKAVNAAQAEYNRLVSQGAQDSARGRAALQTLNQAIVQQQGDQEAANNSIRQAHGEHEKLSRDLQDKLGGAYKNLQVTQDRLAKTNERYNRDVKEGMGGVADLSMAARVRQKELAANEAAQRRYNAAVREASIVADKLTTDTINAHRVQAGMPLVLENQAVAVGRLGKQIMLLGGANANKAFNFVVHTPNPADLVRISNIINKLDPKDKKAAITILANTATAQQALAQLNRIQVKDKRLKVDTAIGDTVAQLAKVQGISLTPKEQKLLSTGGPGIIAQIARVNGIRLPAKVLALLGNASDALRKHQQVAALRDVQKALSIIGNNAGALGAIGAVIGALNNVRDKSVTVAVTGVLRGNMKAFRFSSGGISAIPKAEPNPAVQRMQDQAALDAGRRSTERTRGGAYTRPTFLVGEEHRPEFVIATNPAYRRQNMRYLKMAGAALGAEVTPAASGYAPAGFSTDAKRGGKKGKQHHKQFHYHPLQAFNGLPAEDRIGGIGVDDITVARDAASKQVTYDNSEIKKTKSKIKTLDSQISKYNRMNKLTASQKAAKAQEISDRNDYAGYETRMQRHLRRDSASLKTRNDLLFNANHYITTFDALENDINTVRTLRDAAGQSPDDIATGPDPSKGGEIVTMKWQDWNTLLGTLDSQYSTQLRKAYLSVKGLKNLTNTDVKTKYVSTLEAAYGQAIGTEVSDDTTADPNAPAPGTDVAGKSKTVNGIQYNNPEALTDWLSAQSAFGMTYTDILANDNLAYTNAQLAVQAAPGDPTAFSQEVAAAQGLKDFYNTVYAQTGKWVNPVTNATDPSLINEAGQALLGAEQTLSGLTVGTGPTGGQMLSTALYDTLRNYGGNSLMIQQALAGSGPMPDVTAAMASGTVAADALSAASRASVAGSALPAGAGSGSTAQPVQAGHVVHNHFSHPPEDPHTWSKGILWELNA